MYPNQPSYIQYNNYNDPNNPASPYYIPPKDSFKVTTKRTKIIEFLMILTPIVVMLVLSIFTFTDHYRDRQKEYHIQQVIKALRLYYQNSSNVEIKRSYPVSVSATINEVDYEFTLRRHLTGQTPLDRHAYILDQNFPKDPWGVYSEDFINRPVPFNRLERLPIPLDQTRYLEGYSSCNFRFGDEKFSRCYLYASVSNGETFSIAYYSEVRKKFVVHTETRNREFRIDYI